MKKILILLLSLLFCFSLTVSLGAETAEETEVPVKQYIFDEELDLLTEEEETKLNEQLQATGDRLNADIVVVLTDYLYTEISEEAYQFYENGDFRENGAIYYCAITEGFWHMLPFGDVDEAYTDAAYDLLEESCLDLLREGNYYQSLSTFGEITGDLIDQARAGDPYKGDFPWIEYLGIALILGFVVALIVVLVFKAQLKSVRRQSAARNYLKQDSLNVTEQRDLFLYRTVSRVAKPKNNSSSGGGSRGGRGGRI